MTGDGGLDALVEAIYEAALDGAAWPRAVALLRQRFRSVSEAFYFHDDAHHAVYPIHNGGIAPRYVRRFAELAARPDYPWLRAAPLRRRGVLRTEARLVRHTGDARAIRDSVYFHEWLRPQGLDHSLGITLLQEDGVSAKITLLRAADDGAFGRAEERDFLRVAAHLGRALTVSRRLELLLSSQAASFATLDRMPYGVLLLEAGGRIAYANAVAEARLAARDGLRDSHGMLAAADARDDGRLAALLDATLRGAAQPDSVTLRRPGGRRLVLSALRLSAERRLLVTTQAAILLLVVDPDAVNGGDIDLVRRLYRLTDAEARLAEALLAGATLRQAADAAGIAYETARWHLKALFAKTDTGRQAELVARLIRDIAAIPLV